MKVTRSTKCSLRFSTERKRNELHFILLEYGRTVNIFIDYFWKNGIVAKNELLKPIVDIPETWLSARMRKEAAREALDMVKSAQGIFESNKDQLAVGISSIESKLKTIKPDSKRNRAKINRLHVGLKKKKMKFDMMQPQKPKHRSKKMNVSCTIVELQLSRRALEFDAWLHLASIGNKIRMDLPIKYHKHFRELNSQGQRLNAYIIAKDYVQFCFERETGPKKEVKSMVGVDTGINSLASLSTGEQVGQNIKEYIERVKRCKWGSKGHKRASNALKQRISEVAKQVVNKTDLIVVEKLKNL